MNMNERIKGGLFGLVVGDALGVPVEFKPRSDRKIHPVTDMEGYGTYNQPPGTWSDDSSLALCLAASLSEKGYDLQDQGERFLRWYREGCMTPWGIVFDIGNATANALRLYGQGTDAVSCGGRSETDNGNGGLMRILPAAFYFAALSEKDCYDRIKEIVSVTHGHWISVLSCFIYVLFARNLCTGLSRSESLASASAAIRNHFENGLFEDVPPDGLLTFSAVLDGSFAGFPEERIRSGGYVIDTLTAALWCFFTTETYADCVLKAVNLGEDTDTTAAVAGGIAGAYYGYGSIPQKWTGTLARSEYLEELIDDFVSACGRGGISTPFSNSYWIVPGKLLAGEYPRCLDDAASRTKLAALLDTGVTCIIDLTCEGEHSRDGELIPYSPLLRSMEKIRPGQKICTIIRMEIEDANIPDSNFMQRILDTIDAHLDTGGVVYFHCWGGHGRTGTVAGCWITRHAKAQGEEVFVLISHLRRNMKNACKPSPETEAQKQFVRKWKSGE